MSYPPPLLTPFPYTTLFRSRLFNVTVNGTAVLSNFDVWTAAGGASKAPGKNFRQVVTNGSLPISLVGVKGNAIIAGSELIANPLPTPPTALTASAGNSQVTL